MDTALSAATCLTAVTPKPYEMAVRLVDFTPLGGSTPLRGDTCEILTEGWNDNGGVRLGDLFTIAGVNAREPGPHQNVGAERIFTVTAVRAETPRQPESGDPVARKRLTIRPAPRAQGQFLNVAQNPVDQAELFLHGAPGVARQPSLLFTKNALALVTAPLERPPGCPDSNVATFQDISVRVNAVYHAETDQSYWRVDCLYGVGVLDHRQGVRITQPDPDQQISDLTRHSETTAKWAQSMIAKTEALTTAVGELKTALLGTAPAPADSILSVLKSIKTNTDKS